MTFEKDVRPVLQAKCVRCHGATRQKGDLDLRSAASLLRGGESGPVVRSGSAPKSLLWEKVAADEMPPGKDKLRAAEKAMLRAWIDSGMGDIAAAGENQGRIFWSFRPPARPALPHVRHGDRVRNPIDAFVLAALEKRGLTLAPEADRVTLLRRAYADLIGLPPSPADVDDFLADTRPDAYERLIDRLLASPHYGERWGRHWLDLAGYADSEGILDADYPRKAAWRYRDYVIRAFNADKPYDRFLQEQVAGDELVDYWVAYRTQKELRPEVIEALIATGYLRCASDTSRPDFVTIKNAPGYYYQTLDDTLRIVASSTLGLTLECARCHNHKYDPIPQREYYQLQAVFMSAYRPGQWIPQEQRRVLEATEVQEQQANRHNARVDAELARLRAQLGALQGRLAVRLFEDRLARLPAAIREDVRAALNTVPMKRSEVQKYLAAKFQDELRPALPGLARVLAETYAEYREESQAIDAAIRAEEKKRRTLPEIRALYDLPFGVKTPLLRRGDYRNPGPDVEPGVLSAVGTSRPFRLKRAESPEDALRQFFWPTFGRRLALARWLTQPDHPLTARVLVNRLWEHHFGEGIVATPANFGHAGSPPTHPELLDWLATEFVARGWSIKSMHRLLMTSSAYRQTSVFDPVAQAAARRVDPDNHLLWRQRLRRLEAEPLRDSILAVAGTMTPAMYGPPVPMLRQADGEVVAPPDVSGRRRSIYLQVRRSQPLTLLQVFDQPVMETNCTRRATSTVSSQALTLLNSDLLVRQAEAFAERARTECPGDPAGYAFRLALVRAPTAAERQRMNDFLAGRPGRGALVDLCQMLLAANEFAYVD